jgi:hypothetical protein
MKQIISIFIIATIFTTTIHLQSAAPGCVAVRQMGGLGAMSPQSDADNADQNLRNSKISDASKLVHVQGDAAFADYSISLGYSYRFAKNKKHA